MPYKKSNFSQLLGCRNEEGPGAAAALQAQQHVQPWVMGPSLAFIADLEALVSPLGPQ